MPQENSASEARVRVSNPWLEWIDRYFSGQHHHRFNGFGLGNENEYYYNQDDKPERERSRAEVCVEWVAFNEIMQGADMVYIPCGISSGLRAHEEIDRKNKNLSDGQAPWLSTYKAQDWIGNRHKEAVINPNRDDNLRRAHYVQRLFPDSVVVAPVIREAAVREITKTAAFANWQHYEEEDYMAFWYPVIDRCRKMVLDGDWNFSRNSIWEMMRGVLIQAGEIPSRPDADMDVVDINGDDVSLLWRAEKLVETLQYQIGKGFEMREAATALAQILTIDEELRSGVIPESRVHRVLKHRSTEELQAMDAIKQQWKPLLQTFCSEYLRHQNLPDAYRAKEGLSFTLKDEVLKGFRDVAQRISDKSAQILSLNFGQNLEQTQKPQRIYDSYSRFFEPKFRALLFEDNLYDKLTQWEQLIIPFAIGGMETGLLPINAPAATCIFTDLKRGREGFKRAQQKGSANMREIDGALGREMEDLKSHNLREAERCKEQLQRDHPGTVVVNTPSFLRIAATIDCFRNVLTPEKRLVAAVGSQNTSSQGRLVLQMKFLDRNVENALFQEGWEHSNDLVQLRVRARLIQAGLVERPAGAGAVLNIASMLSPSKPESLLEDIQTLYKEVQRNEAADVRAPEQVLALARLIALHELVMNPSLREKTVPPPSKALINPHALSSAAFSYDRQTANHVCQEATALLKNSPVLCDIPLERLQVNRETGASVERENARLVQNDRMLEYCDAQKIMKAQQGWEQRARPSSGVQVGSGRG